MNASLSRIDGRDSTTMGYPGTLPARDAHQVGLADQDAVEDADKAMITPAMVADVIASRA
jgi:hypothetical protein